MSVKITRVETKPEVDPYHRDTQGLTRTELTIVPESMECYISQEYDDNSTSADKWNGMIIGRKLTGTLNSSYCKNFLESKEGQELLDSVCEGWSDVWNGNNYVGALNESGNNALDELVEELESLYSEDEYWTCSDYFDNLNNNELGISSTTTDEEIKSLSEKLDEEFLIDDVESYLLKRRNSIVSDIE